MYIIIIISTKVNESSLKSKLDQTYVRIRRITTTTRTGFPHSPYGL